MFDRWFTARFRRIFSALILAFTIASMGATASATVVLQPGAPEVSSKGAAAKSMRLAGAITAVQRTDYDVALMDIQMPGMDGVAATQAIRRLDGLAAKVPIIALTANAMVGDEEKYRSMGADGYVSKPIEPVELFNATGQCCGTDFELTSSDSPLGAKSRADLPPEVAEEAANFIDSLDDLMDRTD